MRKKKPFLWLFGMMLCLLVCLSPSSAGKADIIPIGTGVSTLAELRAACARDDAYVFLRNNISGTDNSALVVISGDNVTLNLNGYQLTNTFPSTTAYMTSVIDVLGCDVSIGNGTLSGVYGICAAKDSCNLVVGNIETSENMETFLSSDSDCNGYTVLDGVEINCRSQFQSTAIHCRGRQTVTLEDVTITHGQDDLSAYGYPSYSLYPAISIGKETGLTMVNTIVHKRVLGKIVQCQNLTYDAYGDYTAPDGAVTLDDQNVLQTVKLTTSTDEIGGERVNVRLIEGTDLSIESEMQVIPCVECYLELPAAGALISYDPYTYVNRYYLADHNIGNIYHDVSWQVWDETIGRWDMDAVSYGDRFEPGKRYRILFDMTAKEGFFFASESRGFLNGELADTYWVGGSRCTFRIIKEFPEVELLTGWQKDAEGRWFLYDDNGTMLVGWQKRGGTWYYLGTDGVMQTGWQKIGGKWYWFHGSGAMATGWREIGGKWYYFAGGGAMQTGWQKISGKWYYLAGGGAMVTGWQTINKKTYYFKSSGAMAANEWVTGYWWLNADGTWTYKYKGSWNKNSKGWWFGDTSGWYAKNTTIIINNKSYSFDAGGYMK